MLLSQKKGQKDKFDFYLGFSLNYHAAYIGTKEFFHMMRDSLFSEIRIGKNTMEFFLESGIAPIISVFFYVTADPIFSLF